MAGQAISERDIGLILKARMRGVSYGEIAAALWIPKSTVYSIVRRFTAADPEDCQVNLPVNVLTRDGCETDHIPPGENLYCTRCDGHGLEGHPNLARIPADDPKPEPKPPEAEKPKPTRKQRRVAMKRGRA